MTGSVIQGALSEVYPIDLKHLMAEAIKSEFNMEDLYIGFHNRFPEDATFWMDLAIEEKNHASLLLEHEQCILDSEVFPSEIQSKLLETLIEKNCLIEDILRSEIESPPLERIHAFKLALKLEESAGEILFQRAVQKTVQTSEALKLLQRLNKDDKNHADRIRRRMRQNGMA